MNEFCSEGCSQASSSYQHLQFEKFQLDFIAYVGHILLDLTPASISTALRVQNMM